MSGFQLYVMVTLGIIETAVVAIATMMWHRVWRGERP